MEKRTYNETYIFTNIVELCKFMQKTQCEIVKMEPVKDCVNENVIKVTCRYADGN